MTARFLMPRQSAVILHIFNPETDFALAVGNGPYTAPSHVMALRKEMALLPSVYAGEGNLILVTDDYSLQREGNNEFKMLVAGKKLKIIKESELPEISGLITSIRPWGWNHNLRRYLVTSGVNEAILPDEGELDKYKILAHRRTCIPFRQLLAEKLNINPYHVGEEIFSIEGVKDFLKRYPYSYFKSPWSSSGRGVVSSTHISEKGLFEWTSGSIRRQGSVLAERGDERILDFATEWKCENRKAIFLGLSVFKTSPRGKYQGNVSALQEELNLIISSASPYWNADIIAAQQEVVEELIARDYTGPLGIDMLIDKEKKINLCVEINLRLTMGHIEIMRDDKRADKIV